MKTKKLLTTVKISICAVAFLLPSLSFGSYISRAIPTPEGVDLLSTGVANGLVLVADGNGTSQWTSVTGTGDVVGPSSSIATQVPVFGGTSGKAIASPPGSSSTKYFKLDHTVIGEQAYLHDDLNGALSYIVHNENSGASSRAIVSFGTDIGVNVFSVQSVSSNWPVYPSTAQWASHFTNGSVFINSDPHAPMKFVQGTQTVMQIEGANLSGADGTVTFKGASGTETVKINAASSPYFVAAKNVNGDAIAAFNNSNSGSSAYTELQMNANGGASYFGHSSTGVGGSWLQGDQAYWIANNNNGILIATQGATAPLIVSLGGSSASNYRMKVTTTGGMWKLPTYADNAAAVSAGLAVNDLYQVTGTGAVYVVH